ncbi:helix-turn-helix domain-containing protein [Streptomyces sp. B15]|uniref:helix-turn-helix domain-containing protein n=1 Tax=Streptomyces sp. B15 TaxID=1537797 RepID=UPI001B397FA7|nr:helix-turn-helix transcriptional regulator [Streptomyces sp. B15]MBQ1122585.1 helix-turn-helix transcriptional regulator [Streptomyces sp. B15]
MYRLRVRTLLSAAEKLGDTTGYAIAQRSGVPESSVSRIVRGQSQPGVISLLRLCRTYGLDIDDLIEEIHPVELAS